jgi:Family of unknown function (DUF6152)
MNENLVGVLATALLIAGPASAHHSFAMFDYNREITLLGEVKQFNWTNPHIHILINVPDDSGKINEWDIEGATPNSIRRSSGWGRETLKPGDKISIVVRPMKDGSFGAMMVRASRPDGTVFGNPPKPEPTR